MRRQAAVRVCKRANAGLSRNTHFNGLPFGVTEDFNYTETTLPISPGDAFLFVTDGAFEIDNAHREQLGIEGLIAVLEQLGYPATPLDMHRLEERLLLFSNEIRLPDDLTILEIGFRNDARAPSG